MLLKVGCCVLFILLFQTSYCKEWSYSDLLEGEWYNELCSHIRSFSAVENVTGYPIDCGVQYCDAILPFGVSSSFYDSLWSTI